MGRVYLAEDPLIDREVAIKVMAAEGDEEARERFRNEARAAGQMSHPNVVQLYEFGFHQGQPYLVMEYLVGESLDEWLARKQPLEARLSILLDLCRAIGHAHSRGVLHRDVKPSNLQVLPDGTCKLMDFGIARSRSVHITATGMILGTPQFIAPEVLQDAGYSPRSDLFAVALVCYQALSGANPFHAQTLEGCLTRVLTYEPPPLAEACADVPAELSGVISRYLCKDPEERAEDVRPLMTALERLQDRTERLASDPPFAPPPADPISRPEVSTEGPTIRDSARPAPGGRRSPAGAILFAALVVVLAVATFWRPWSGPGPVAETAATPPPVVDGGSPATDTGPEHGAAAAAAGGTPPAIESQSAPEPEARSEQSSTADRTGSDPEPAATGPAPAGQNRRDASPPVPPTEKIPRDDPVADAAAEAGRTSPPAGQDVAEPRVEPAPARDGGPVERGDALAGRPSEKPPAPATREPSTPAPREPPPVETPVVETSADESAPEETGADPSAVTPRILRLEPVVVRRGSTVALRITGEGFGPESEVVIRRGGRPVRGLRILRSTVESASKLRVTVLVDRQLPLGTYTVTVVDGGRESHPASLEVGL